MEDKTLAELVREYGKAMDLAGRYTALGSVAARVHRSAADRLLAEIERRITDR